MRVRRVAIAVGLIVTSSMLAGIPPASAARGPAHADVDTNPGGARVTVTRRGAWVEVAPARPPGSGGGGGAVTTGCQRRWVPTKAAIFLRPGRTGSDLVARAMPPSPSPEHRAYFVYCDDDYITSVWLLPGDFLGGPDLAALRAIAEELVRDLPYPNASIGANPEGRGLTGLETWFWVTGYTSAPIRDAVSTFGITVEVEARPDRVQWDFGDGGAAALGTLGRAYPRRSDVRHTFESRTQTGSSFEIRATIRLSVRWRADGGAWESLPPVERSAARGYPVIESRAALVPER